MFEAEKNVKRIEISDSNDKADYKSIYIDSKSAQEFIINNDKKEDFMDHTNRLGTDIVNSFISEEQSDVFGKYLAELDAIEEFSKETTILRLICHGRLKEYHKAKECYKEIKNDNFSDPVQKLFFAKYAVLLEGHEKGRFAAEAAKGIIEQGKEHLLTKEAEWNFFLEEYYGYKFDFKRAYESITRCIEQSVVNGNILFQNDELFKIALITTLTKPEEKEVIEQLLSLRPDYDATPIIEEPARLAKELVPPTPSSGELNVQKTSSGIVYGKAPKLKTAKKFEDEKYKFIMEAVGAWNKMFHSTIGTNPSKFINDELKQLIKIHNELIQDGCSEKGIVPILDELISDRDQTSLLFIFAYLVGEVPEKYNYVRLNLMGSPQKVVEYLKVHPELYELGETSPIIVALGDNLNSYINDE